MQRKKWKRRNNIVFSNTWVVEADIKFKYSSSVPTFRRKDTAVINFLIYDNKEIYDISTFTSGEVTITFPRGHYIVKPCSKVVIDDVSYIQYVIDKDELVELGTYKFNLSFQNASGRVSIQDILVNFFDSLGTAELAYIKLIQDLQNQVTYLESLVGNIVLKSTKGKPNGLVELDANGKIKELHMPEYLREHVDTDMYLNWVHGFYIDENGVAKYRTKDGGEENVGHPDVGTKINVTVKVANGVATLTFTGTGSVVAKRYMFGDLPMSTVKQSGIVLSGNSFSVDKVGIWSVYYRDDKNNDFIFKFSVATNDLKTPDTKINVSDGKVTIISDTKIALSKYEKGKQDVAYFQTKGVVFTGNFPVAEAGEYSIYIKYEDGREIVYYLTVTEEDLEKVDTEPPVIAFALAPSNSTTTSANKILTVSVTDANSAPDKRYYYRKYTDANGVNPSINTFRDDLLFGTKMTASTQQITVTENGIFYVYAKDSMGNDVMNQFTIYSIDKVGAYKVSYVDSWNEATGRYVITVDAYNQSTNTIVGMKPSLTYFNSKVESGDLSSRMVYEVAQLQDHTIEVTTQTGIKSVFDIKMRGRIEDIHSGWGRTVLVLYESGKIFGQPYGETVLMGYPQGTTFDRYKFYEVPLAEKVTKLHVNNKGVLALTSVGNVYVWGEPWYLGLGFKYPMNTKVWSPTRLTEMANVKEIFPANWNLVYKASDNKFYGIGDTSTSFGNNTEIAVSRPTQLGQSINYSNLWSDGERTYFFGNDSKLYGSGWNSNAELGIPFRYPYIYPQVTESTMINALGVASKVLSVAQHPNVYFHLTDGKMYAIGASLFWDSREKTAISVSGYPTNDPPKDKAFYNYNHAILSESGDVYVNGLNEGALGLGHFNAVPFDTFVKLPLSGKARKVRMGLVGNEILVMMNDGKVLGADEETGQLVSKDDLYSFPIESAKK